VFVFGVLVQSGFRAELSTALRASELSSTRRSTYTDRFHHSASDSDNGAQDCQANASELNCVVYVHGVKVPPGCETCNEYYHSEYEYGRFHFSIRRIRVNVSHLSHIKRRIERGRASLAGLGVPVRARKWPSDESEFTFRTTSQ